MPPNKPIEPNDWDAAALVRRGLTVEEATAQVFSEHLEKLTEWASWWAPFGPQCGAMRDYNAKALHLRAYIAGTEMPPADPWKGSWVERVEALAKR